MTQERLKLLRVVVPGTMLLLMLMPLIRALGLFDGEILADLKNASLVVVFAGALFYILNLRSWFFRRPIERHNLYLRERLLDLLPGSEFVRKNRGELLRSRKLLPVFYHLLDTDPSLTKKAQNVYFNGVMFSSVADAQTTALIGMLLYSGLSLAKSLGAPLAGNEDFLIPALLSFVVFVLCLVWLLPLVERKHRLLFDEEVEYIEVHLLGKLREKVEALQVD